MKNHFYRATKRVYILCMSPSDATNMLKGIKTEKNGSYEKDKT